MNISNISFGNKYFYDPVYPQGNRERNVFGNTSEYSIKITPSTDTYERHPRSEKYQTTKKYQPKHLAKKADSVQQNQQAATEYIDNNKKRRNRKKIIATAVGGAAATLIMAQCIAAYNAPAQVITIPVKNYKSIYEIAGLYKSDIDAILAYNDLQSLEEFYQQDEVQVPSLYNYVQDEIAAVQERLRNPHLSSSERVKLEERISKLRKKQSLQQNLATVYTDGKFVYYTINKLGNNSKYSSGINVEDFKKIFDIKDRAIRQNNDIEYEWGYSDEEGGYRDFTRTTLHTGETIKVPVNAIKTGSGINLD